VKQKLVNFCLEEGGYGENADADQRHQIIKTMIYLEKTDAGDNDCEVVCDRRRHLGDNVESSASVNAGNEGASR